MQAITIAGPAVEPLRTGLYSLLATDADRLSSACEHPERESTPDARLAFEELERTVAMLDLAGWEQPASRVVFGVSASERLLALRALSVVCEAAQDAAADARAHGDDETADARQAQALLAADTLAAIETTLREDEPRGQLR